MRKILLLFAAITLFACKKEQQKDSTESPTTNTKQIDTSKIGRNNYAVVWQWKTKDEKLLNDNIQGIRTEMNTLWENDIITDVYYNSSTKVTNLSNFPNVSLILKAHTKKEAHKILDKLILVQKNMASYNLYPIGIKWLDRNGKKVHENGLTKSFVSVWHTEKNEKLKDNNLTKQQSDAILKLYNEGKIENVYFDIEGIEKTNEKTDFVFFINANTIEEAKKICDNLPFTKQKVATYKLIDVGVFWLGIYKK